MITFYDNTQGIQRITENLRVKRLILTLGLKQALCHFIQFAGLPNGHFCLSVFDRLAYQLHQKWHFVYSIELNIF